MTQTTENTLISAADREAILHLREAVCGGQNWYISLLEAIGLWTSSEELCDGRHFRYLIGGEAFDWLTLAHRLCLEITDLVSEEQRLSLLFCATPPVDLPEGEFRRLIGEVKYRAYLNYLYGVIVEEGLLAAVEDEILKESAHLTLGLQERVEREAYVRIYDADLVDLLALFKGQRGWPGGEFVSLTELKEFTYWLFKYRVEHSEKARVASDTRKALVWLQQQWNRSARKAPPHASAGIQLLLGQTDGA